MWKLLLLAAVGTASSDPSCPSGSIYSAQFNSCYKFVKQPVPYFVAEQDCVNDGGHLASIRSAAENSFIADTAQSSADLKDTYYWIGATEVSSSEWYWTDGSRLNYTNWGPGQLDLNRCGSLRSDGGPWAKMNCDSNLSFVCKIESAAAVTCPTCSAGHSYCDSEWAYFEPTDSCYKGFFNATWSEAESTCNNYDSHLASIHSNDENDFIYDLVTMNNANSKDTEAMTWFGLHRETPQSNIFVYSDGSKLDYQYWAPTEPGSEQCVLISTDVHTLQKNGVVYYYEYHWSVANCNLALRRFVCKKAANHI